MNFLLGLTLGFTGAVLLAPASGQQTRRKLVHQAQKFTTEHFQETAEKITEAAREKAGEIGSEVGRHAAESVVESMLQNPEKRRA